MVNPYRTHMEIILIITIPLMIGGWYTDHLTTLNFPYHALGFYIGYGLFLLLIKEYPLSHPLLRLFGWPILTVANIINRK